MANNKLSKSKNIHKQKQARPGAQAERAKSAKYQADPSVSLQAPIAWNFKHMDNDGEWQCNIVCLEEFKSWLHGFEGQKAASIFAKGSQYRHSHPMPVDKICNAAKSRLEKLNLEPEAMFQLEIGRVPRLWGFLEHNIFHVVWVDREHTVYPMK